MEDNKIVFEIYSTRNSAMPYFAEELKNEGYNIEPLQEKTPEPFFKEYKYKIEVETVQQLIDISSLTSGEIVLGVGSDCLPFIEIYNDYRE